MRAVDLRVQELENPLGIQNPAPVMSYLLQARDGEFQSAYRILAASGEGVLSEDRGDLWDSGVCTGKRNFGIVYGGKKLVSRQRIFWKVKVWNQNGEESPWSEMAFFEMGLLSPEDWKGSWIGQGDDYEGNQPAAPVFSCDFEVNGLEFAAFWRAYISGLGIFYACVNGKPLSDAYFEPGESDATRRVFYVVYDLKDFLREGKNTLTVFLGSGQYAGYTIEPVMVLPDGSRAKGRYQKNDSCYVKPGICGKKKLIAQVETVGRDGNVRLLAASSESWRWKNGPVIFQNWYGGEDYDAAGTEELWRPAVKMTPPAGRLFARECPPIREAERFPAASVKRLGDGHFLVDMGKNGAGICELHLKKMTARERGSWIYMYPAETLNEAGDGVDQRSCTQSWSQRYDCVIRDSYRVGGYGEEVWHPLFCYHGFRYLEVTGFPGEASPENFICICLRADNPRRGCLNTSNEIINQIKEMTERSIESNMFWSFTDCPQIEKLGWIETSHLMFRSVALAFDIRSWMRKIIEDICDSQVDGTEEEEREPAGFVPGIVPEFYRIRGLYRDPNWNGACVFTPWEYYQYYGDVSVLREAFPVMRRYLSYLKDQTKDGVLEDYAQMGEWGEYGEHTPEALVATGAYYRMLCIASKTAEILECHEEARYFEGLAEATRKAFFRHPDCAGGEDGQFGTGSQASYGCALFSGLVEGEKKAEAVKRLTQAVSQNGDHLTSGEVGLRQVFAVLSENGRSDVVYRMIMNETAPSYRFFTGKGLTTLPEYWNYEELWHGMVRSRNHAMMGHVREWLTCFLLGVRPKQPGWEEVEILPYFPEDTDWAEGCVFTSWGEIRVRWEKNREKTEAFLCASIPPGVTAVVWESKEGGGPKDGMRRKELGCGKHRWRMATGGGRDC